MMRKLLFLLLAAACCLSLSVLAVSSRNSAPIRYVPGEILVKYRPGTMAAKPDSLNAALGSRTLRTLGKFAGLQIHLNKLPAGMSVEQAVEFFRSDPAVEYAEPNYIYKFTRTPDDTSFNLLWALKNSGQAVNGISGTAGADISAAAAWDVQTDGDAVVVAVLDSGVDYNHDDLKGNMVAGWDFLAGNASPMDSLGHGTHVAGTIGAIGNNAKGISGVAWKAKIMPVRIGDEEGVASSDIVAGVDYARQHGAKIINASFGGYSASTAVSDAISAANSAGILLIASAGNESNNNDAYPVYPAGYGMPNIIAVAATDQNDRLSSYSNYGKTSVHVAAPGDNIYSLAPSTATAWTDDFSVAPNGWSFGGDNSTWAITGGVLTNVPYANNSDSWAMSPVQDLTGFLACRLVFQIKGGCEYPHDLINLELSADSGATWASPPLLSYSGSVAGWYEASFDIRAYDNKPNVRLRFRFTSNATVTTGGGWEIDNIRIMRSATDYTAAYQFMDGTSMAAPHVAGMAALLWSKFPAYTAEQIRYMIINSAEKLDSLTDMVSSRGRINLFNALNLPNAPTGLTASAAAPGRVELGWTSNSPDAAGFRIEAKNGAAGSYSQVGEVPITQTTFSHVGAPTNSTVFYRVRSFNSSGNSFYCAEASALTPSAPVVEGSSGGCFIATAAYGSPNEGGVMVLRAFRDRYLLASGPGKKLVRLYYRLSPPLADFIAGHETAKTAMRFLLAPLVAMSYLAVKGGPAAVLLMFVVSGFAVLVSFRLYKL